MKKLMCVVALMLGMSTATFGSDNRVFGTEDTNSLAVNYNINVNAKSLVRYLELSEDQESLVMEFQRTFEKSLFSASDIQAKPMRKAIVENAVKSNLRNMNCILTKKQYRKYTRVLNLSLKNRRIIE
jgi:hypothetical protein